MTYADIVQDYRARRKRHTSAAPRDFVSSTETAVADRLFHWYDSAIGRRGVFKRELQVLAALSALGFLMSNEIHVDDVVLPGWTRCKIEHRRVHAPARLRSHWGAVVGRCEPPHRSYSASTRGPTTASGANTDQLFCRPLRPCSARWWRTV